MGPTFLWTQATWPESPKMPHRAKTRVSHRARLGIGFKIVGIKPVSFNLSHGDSRAHRPGFSALNKNGVAHEWKRHPVRLFLQPQYVCLVLTNLFLLRSAVELVDDLPLHNRKRFPMEPLLSPAGHSGRSPDENVLTYIAPPFQVLSVSGQLRDGNFDSDLSQPQPFRVTALGKMPEYVKGDHFPFATAPSWSTEVLVKRSKCLLYCVI